MKKIFYTSFGIKDAFVALAPDSAGYQDNPFCTVRERRDCEQDVKNSLEVPCFDDCHAVEVTIRRVPKGATE